jgi:hypothetical protein
MTGPVESVGPVGRPVDRPVDQWSNDPVSGPVFRPAGEPVVSGIDRPSSDASRPNPSSDGQSVSRN